MLWPSTTTRSGSRRTSSISVPQSSVSSSPTRAVLVERSRPGGSKVAARKPQSIAMEARAPSIIVPPPDACGYGNTNSGGPMIDGALASIAIDCGFRAATFDPPGLDRSTRTARVGLEETLDCGTETLDVLRLPERVVVLGHSMSALCAFYFALAHPERVARLVLVGTPPGSGMAIVRYRAMPFQWPPWHSNLWRMVGWGSLLAQGRGNLETHKKMDLLQQR